MEWFRASSDNWRAVAEHLQRLGDPWPQEAAAMDMQWHIGTGRKLPSSRGLVKRWGWTTWRVRTFLAAPGTWWDPEWGPTLPNSRDELNDVIRRQAVSR